MNRIFTLISLSFLLMTGLLNAQTAYIPNSGDNTVSVINLITNSVYTTIPVGSFPTSVSVSDDGMMVYIGNQNDSTISAISTTTNTVIATIPIGTTPNCLVVSPDGRKVYVTGVNDRVIVINTATNTVSNSIPVGQVPYGIAVNPNGNRIYVANYNNGNGNTISVIDTVTNNVMATIPVNSAPYGIIVSPDGSIVYATFPLINSVTSIDATTNYVTATTNYGIHNPTGICITPNNYHIYISNTGTDTVSMLYTPLNYGPPVLGFNSPKGLSVSPDGSKVFVANSGNGTVSIINVSSNYINFTIPVGNAPVAFGNFISNHISCTAPAMPLHINGNSGVCYGTANTFDVNNVTGATSYTWTIPAGWTGSSTSSSITVHPDSTNGIITVTANDSCGSSSPMTLDATVVYGPPAQVANIIGPDTVCVGSNVLYYVPLDSWAYNYQWNVPWMGTRNNDSISCIVGAYSGNIYVTAQNGCGSTSSSMNANVITAPPATSIMGYVRACAGSTIYNYGSNYFSGVTNYAWTLPNGWTGISSTDTIYSIVGTMSGTITLVESNMCGSRTASLFIPVDTLPPPQISIVGPDSICQSSTELYITTPQSSGTTTFNWNVPNGWSGSIWSDTLTAIVGSSSGNISVFASNGCGSSTASIPVHVSAFPQLTIVGNNQPCNGSTVTYNISAIDSTLSNFSWSLPNGWTGSSTSDSITTTIGTTGGLIIVSASNQCGTHVDTLNTVVRTIPPAPSPITGPDSACQYTTVNYFIFPDNTATSYTWTLPSGWTFTSTSNIITATVGINSGNVTVYANNACGSSSSVHLYVTVLHHPVPINIIGPDPVCEGSTDLYYASPNVNGITGYTWTLPNGWTGSSTTDSIMITVGPNNGLLTVSAYNQCGSNGAGFSMVVLTAPPPPTGNIIGPSSVCYSSVNTFQIPVDSSYSTYIWSIPNSWSGSSTTNSITTTAGPISGNVTVSAQNACGLSTGSTLPVNVISIPAIPGPITGNTIVPINSAQTYSISSVVNATGYHWTIPLNWIINSGQGTTSINVTVGSDLGNVCVDASDSCGTSSQHCLTITMVTGINSPVSTFNSQNIIFPNPNNGKFTLTFSFPKSAINNCELGIMDVLGRTVYTQPITNPTQSTINIPQLSNGVYFYQLTNTKETFRGKFVKE